MELMGDLFNFIIKLEMISLFKFFNLMINVGVLVIISMLEGKDNEEKMECIFYFVCEIIDNFIINYFFKVVDLELEIVYLNCLFCYYMK